MILTINTAHPFFEHLYEPLRKLGNVAETGDEDAIDAPRIDERDGPLVALELLLMSLARAQAQIVASNEEARKTMETLRREWSETYRIQLTA